MYAQVCWLQKRTPHCTALYAFAVLCVCVLYFALLLYLLCLCISENQLDCVYCTVSTPYHKWTGKCLCSRSRSRSSVFTTTPLHWRFLRLYLSLCVCVCARNIHSFDSCQRLYCGLNLIKSVLTNSNEVLYNNLRRNKAKSIPFSCRKIYRTAALTPFAFRFFSLSKTNTYKKNPTTTTNIQFKWKEGEKIWICKI